MLNQQENVTSTNDLADEPWDETIVRFSRVPKKWMWQWLKDLQCDFDDDVIAKIVRANGSDILDQVFMFGLEMRLNEKVPKLCHDKLVMARVLKARYTSAGARLNGWLKAAVKEDGAIDWAKKGVFSFVFPRGQDNASEVCHISGLRIPLPEGITITRAWTIKNNYDPKNAAAQHRYQLVPLIELFQGHGLAAVPPTEEHLTNLANSVNQEVEEQRLQSSTGKVEISEGVAEAITKLKRKSSKGPPVGQLAPLSVAAPTS